MYILLVHLIGDIKSGIVTKNQFISKTVFPKPLLKINTELKTKILILWSQRLQTMGGSPGDVTEEPVT